MTAGRVLGYARVSTARQGVSGLGLEAQQAAIVLACDQRGAVLVDLVSDVASGGKADRAGLLEVLGRLKRREADCLMVAKLDRLTRSTGEFATLLEMSRRQRWSLVLLDLGVDTGTAAGELVASVVMSLAQWERRIVSERTKDALAAKRARGERVGGRLPRVPEQVVSDVAGWRAEGLSTVAIARRLDELGVPTAQGGRWRPSTVRWLLLKRAPNGATSQST